jgi:hypothetical protein
MIVLLLMLIISAGGVARYLILGLAHTAPGKGSTSLGQRSGTGTTSSPTIPLSSPTVSPLRLGWPVIGQYSPTEVANGSTTYTLSAYAVDQSIDPGHGNPVHTSSITFKLWLVQHFPTSSTFFLTVKDLQKVNTIQNPLTGSVQGQPYAEIRGLKFDPGTPQTRFSDEKGRVIWKYQISSSITLGEYNLIILTDWNGKYYNWDWANIIITR